MTSRAAPLRAALVRALCAAVLLFGPLLLWGASVRACLRRDIEALGRPNAAGRAAAQARIAALGPPGIEALVESLAGSKPAVPLKMLAGRSDAELIARLVEALDDEDESRRHNAGLTLAYIGADAVPAVVEALRASPVAHVRTSAAWVLSCMGEPGTAALPALEQALWDEDHDVRLVARYAIQQLSSGNEDFWAAVERSRAATVRPAR
jgi:HEAT repeat protein